MPQWVNQTAIRRARRVCLYNFLLARHPGDIIREGNSLRLRSNHSISIKIGYAGFMDFADGNTGNAIECLTNCLGYEFQDAVAALCEFDGMTQAEINSPERPVAAQGTTQTPKSRETSQTVPESNQEPLQAPPRTLIPPEPLQGQYKQLYAYLTQQRSIPAQFIQQLIGWGLLYQEREHNNMVFIDPARTFAELRGSNSFKPFHQVMFSDPAAFWWFKRHGPDSIPNVAFVCEGAIDAISLYLLRLIPPPGSCLVSMPFDENGLYCSIGGIANQQRIARIKAGMAAAGCKTIIAVDNDQAGADCRQRNPDCPALIPRLKDWNEDYIAAHQKEG